MIWKFFELKTLPLTCPSESAIPHLFILFQSFAFVTTALIVVFLGLPAKMPPDLRHFSTKPSSSSSPTRYLFSQLVLLFMFSVLLQSGELQNLRLPFLGPRLSLSDGVA